MPALINTFATGLTIEGLTLTQPSRQDERDIIRINAEDATLRNNIIRNSVTVSDEEANILNNTFEIGQSAGLDDAIRCQHTATIQGNSFTSITDEDLRGVGIRLGADVDDDDGRIASKPDGTVIAENVISCEDSFNQGMRLYDVQEITIDSNTITDARFAGLTFTSQKRNSKDCVIRNNDFTENSRAGINLVEFLNQGDGDEQIRDNTIESNNFDNDKWGIATAQVTEENGFERDTSLTNQVDATCNWWGDPAGPEDDSNPRENPKGDEINGDVKFNPWLVRPADADDTLCLKNGVLKLDVDIQPEKDNRPINPNSRQEIEVKIKESDNINPAEEIDVDSLRFGPSDVVGDDGGAKAIDKEENADSGALTVVFLANQTGFERDDSTGVIVGNTTDDIYVRGSDSVRVVGRRKKGKNGK